MNSLLVNCENSSDALALVLESGLLDLIPSASVTTVIAKQLGCGHG